MRRRTGSRDEDHQRCFSVESLEYVPGPPVNFSMSPFVSSRVSLILTCGAENVSIRRRDRFGASPLSQGERCGVVSEPLCCVW